MLQACDNVFGDQRTNVMGNRKRIKQDITDTNIPIKEGFAEVLENMQRHMAEMDKKLEEIKRRLDNGNG